MNLRQIKFLQANRHLIPDEDSGVEGTGNGTILCFDMGTDSQGFHFGPYTLDEQCRLRNLTGGQFDIEFPPESAVHDHIFRNLKVGDRIKIKGLSAILEDGDDWFTVIHIQKINHPAEVEEPNDKVLVENKYGSWHIISRQYINEIGQLLDADF